MIVALAAWCILLWSVIVATNADNAGGFLRAADHPSQDRSAARSWFLHP